MFHFGKNRTGKNLQAGLAINQGHLSVVIIDRHDKNKPVVTALANLPCPDNQEKNAVLLAARKKFQLEKIPCVFVLNTGDYSLIQTESPNVEKSELKSALRWRIKDMLDFHIDDATIDAFELPAPERQGISQMMYAVAAKSSLIKATADSLLDAGINLGTIDIHEMALHNIAATQIKNADDIAAIAFLFAHETYIAISSPAQVYLCRHIANNLWQSSQQFVENAEVVKNYELLALEMQRSLDYYESHYGKGAANQLIIFHNDTAAPESDNYFSIPTSLIELDQFIDGLTDYSSQDIITCLPALGGALRAKQ